MITVLGKNTFTILLFHYPYVYRCVSTTPHPYGVHCPGLPEEGVLQDVCLVFFYSVFWICLYSYIMVWMMITIIGFIFGIPDP